MIDISKEYKYANIGLLLVMILLLISPFFIYVPELSGSSSVYIKMPPCIIKEHTGKPCPTCGLTHSVVALYNGKIELSKRYNPLGVIFICIITAELLLRIIPIISTHKMIPWIDIAQLLLLGPLISILIYK